MGQKESGLARNLANLGKMIDMVNLYGQIYNPANQQLTVPSLMALQNQCTTDFNMWSAAITQQRTATNAKEIEFVLFNKTVLAVQYALNTVTLPKQVAKDVFAIIKKLRSTGAKLTKADAGKTSANLSDEEVEASTQKQTNSTSQLSYDKLLANFDSLIQMLQTIPAYAPNETNIQVGSLQVMLANLKQLYQNSTNANNSLSMVIMQRNVSFYGNDTGMYDIAKKVKSYVKQLYGLRSPQYKQINALKFTKPYPTKKKKAE